MRREQVISEENSSKKILHITVADQETGNVMADYLTETAIVAGIVQKGVSQTPASILFIGEPRDLISLKNVLFDTIVSFLKKQTGISQKKSN